MIQKYLKLWKRKYNKGVKKEQKLEETFWHSPVYLDIQK